MNYKPIGIMVFSIFLLIGLVSACHTSTSTSTTTSSTTTSIRRTTSISTSTSATTSSTSSSTSTASTSTSSTAYTTILATSTSSSTSTTTILMSNSTNTTTSGGTLNIQGSSGGIPDAWGACMFNMQFMGGSPSVTYWNWWTGSLWVENCTTGVAMNTYKYIV